MRGSPNMGYAHGKIANPFFILPNKMKGYNNIPIIHPDASTKASYQQFQVQSNISTPITNRLNADASGRDIGSISDLGASHKNNEQSLDDDWYGIVPIVEDPNPFVLNASKNATPKETNP